MINYLSKNVIKYIEIHEEINKTYRFCIARTEQEIGTIMQASIFCIDKNKSLSGPVTYAVYKIINKELAN